MSCTSHTGRVEKGAVNAGKATFEVQQPDGPLFKFTLTLVKGRLQGEWPASATASFGATPRSTWRK
jgi:hypothetical protein